MFLKIILSLVKAALCISSPEISSPYYTSGCILFSQDGKVHWKYPALLCHFFPDGRLFAAGDTYAKMLDRNLMPLWEIKLPVHHMVESATDGQSIALLASEILTRKGLRVRSDAAILLGVDGRIRYKYRLAKSHDLQLDPPFLVKKNSQWPYLERETSHANSIHFIPTNRSPIADFQSGNLIVNDLRTGHIFILDQKLRRLPWTLSYRSLGYIAAHDAHVLENGHILLLVNSSKRYPRKSSVDEIDPVTKKVVWSYSGETANAEFSGEIKGSVQALSDGAFLLKHEVNGKPFLREVGPDGHTRWQLDLSQFITLEIQGVYRQEALAEFVRNNAGI